MTIQSIIDSIQSNSLIVTLLSGGVIITFFRYITEIFQYLSKVVLNIISFTIVDRFNNEHFNPIQFKKLMFLLNTKAIPLWLRDVELMKLNYDDSPQDRVSTVPHGKSLFILYGKLIFVDKYYETQGIRMTTHVSIRVFFCTKKKFTKLFLNDIRVIRPKESNDNIEIGTSSDWYIEIEKRKRFIKSIYSPNNAPTTLLNDLKNFISNEKLYKDLNIPYKRNYLLYGKPGTGKTSCVMALASEVDWNIVCIDINKSKIDDIIRTCTQHKNTIFLFEDIDSVTRNITKKGTEDSCGVTSEVSLSQLLNLSDGLITTEKSVCIFTTNHIEMLDEAFLRDGRMDVKVEFKNLDSKTARKMLLENTDITDERLDNISDDICPAYLQELILKYHLGTIDENILLSNIKQK